MTLQRAFLPLLLCAVLMATPAHAQQMTNEDYPLDALKKRQEGVVGIQFDVNEKGQVENCQIMSSSGSDSLDKGSCAIIVKRARYKPATDEAGNPVRSTKTMTFRWRLPH